MTVSIEQAEVIKDRACADLLSVEGVVGVGVTMKDRQAAVQILVRRLTPDVVERLPKRIDGMAVTIEEVGEIHTQ